MKKLTIILFEDVVSKINVEKCIIERVDCKEL